jgi:hypothetical protein
MPAKKLTPRGQEIFNHLVNLLVNEDRTEGDILNNEITYKLLKEFNEVEKKRWVGRTQMNDFLKNTKKNYSKKNLQNIKYQKEQKVKGENFIKIKKTKTTIKKENKIENITTTTETETEKQEIKEIHFNTDQSKKFNQIATDFNAKLEALINKEKIVYYKKNENGEIIKDENDKPIINQHLSDIIANRQVAIIYKMLNNLAEEVETFLEKHSKSNFEKGSVLLFQLDTLYNKAIKIESKDMDRFKELTEIIFNLQKSLNLNSQTDRIIFENTQAKKEIESKEPKIIENDLTEEEALQELKSLEEQDKELKELENNLING